MPTTRVIAAILIACVRGWCAPAIVVPPDRAGDLQSALIESGRTGATVELSGVYVITNQLVTAGARIRGTHGSHHGDWNIGGTVLHFRMPPTNGCVRVTQGPTGNASVIESVAMVFYHQTTPEAHAVALDGASYGSVLRNVLLDRPGRGLVFEPSVRTAPRSLGHRIDELRVNSFRSAAIYCPEPMRTTDHVFTGLIYLNGKPGADYVAGAVPPTAYPVGIDGFPGSTTASYILVENCRVGIRLRGAVNSSVDKLFLDLVRGVAIERSEPYPGRLYDRGFRVGMLTAYAAQPKCRFVAGDPRVEIRVGLQSLALCDERASWINTIGPR